MKLKNIFALLLSVILTCCLSISANAAVKDPDTASPMYTIAVTPKSELYISGTSADCISSSDSSGAVTITVVQTLEKHAGWWSWEPVNGASWSKTVSSSSITAGNSKSGLESGTYRLKSVFTLTNGAGRTETVTVYSTEQRVS